MTKCMTDPSPSPPPPPPIRRRVEQHCPGADYRRGISPRLGMQKEADSPDSSAKKKNKIKKKGFGFGTGSFRGVPLLRSPQAGGRSEVIWSTPPLQLAIRCRVRSSDRGEHGRLEYHADSTAALEGNSGFLPSRSALRGADHKSESEVLSLHWRALDRGCKVICEKRRPHPGSIHSPEESLNSSTDLGS